jgi:hypothetical protein
LNASRRLTRSKGALAVVCPNRTPLRVFEITLTAETLNLATTDEDALALARRWHRRLQSPGRRHPTGAAEKAISRGRNTRDDRLPVDEPPRPKPTPT